MNSQQISQDEEGFIAVKLIQKVSQIDDIRDSKGKQCKPFSPFCLPSGQGSLRLQIPQSLDPVTQFEIKDEIQKLEQSQQQTNKRKIIKRNNSTSSSLQHPYRVYGQNPIYQLVYSKNSSQDPIQNQFQYIKNEVMLQTVQKEREQKSQCLKKHEIVNKLRNPYSRLLRSFDYSIINQKIQRNNSSQTNSSSNKPGNNQFLQFDSKFESGNLYCAYNKVNTNQYNLFIQNDTNSYGYNQWFYFSILNIKKDTQYTFHIVNLKKKHSFFKYGYKPIIFSLKKYQQNQNQNGWYRSGSNIQYQQSNITTSKFFKFYKLTFTLKFNYDNDYILVAANLPYSYTRLSNYLQKFNKQFNISNTDEIATLKIGNIGRTFCGNNVPQIKIIPNQDQIRVSKSSNKNKNIKNKKMIVFLARQHPGQTVSSFLMESILDHLSTFGQQSLCKKQIQSKQKVKYLLKNYTIVIFPMINIDGVIYGNSRCDVSGMDLNRRWKNPSKIFHPQIFNIKNKLQSYARKYDIVGCFDLHGHSKLYNVFCYSCKINPISCRILPYIISKQTNKFNFGSCTFGITRYKSTTARAAIFKIIKNENVLTIQSSYFGFVQSNKQNDECTQIINQENNGQNKIIIQLNNKNSNNNSNNNNNINVNDNNSITNNNKKVIKYFQPIIFNEIGGSILNGLYKFLNRQSKQYNQIQNQIKQNIQQIINLQKINHNQEQSGSQSDPQCDQIDFQTKIHTILNQSFINQALSFISPQQQQFTSINQLTNSLSNHISSIPSQTINPKTQSKLQTHYNQQQNQFIQKNQHINKIRITKIKPQISNRKTFSNQKFKSQLNFINTSSNKQKKQKSKKQTISFSFNKNFKQTTNNLQTTKRFNSTHQQRTANTSQRLYSQTNQRPILGLNRHNQIKILDDPLQDEINQPQSPKMYDDLIIYSPQSKQMLNYQKNNLLQRNSLNPYMQLSSQNDFFLKFQKFFPSHQMSSSSNKKQKLSFLEESIYKDDQRQILNTLMQNKKRLDRQKLKRQSDKINTKQKHNIHSNKLNLWKDQKQMNQKDIIPVIGINGKKRNDIVDFRTFKDRDKLKMQLRQANLAYTKYMKKDNLM